MNRRQRYWFLFVVCLMHMMIYAAVDMVAFSMLAAVGAGFAFYVATEDPE